MKSEIYTDFQTGSMVDVNVNALLTAQLMPMPNILASFAFCYKADVQNFGLAYSYFKV